MEEIGLDAARGAHEAGEQGGNEQTEPRPPAKVAEHAVAEGEPEAAELFRPDDLDVDTASSYVLDGVRDETADDVTGIPGVRRREHRDAHQLWMRKTA
jgi:hypothetical protein